MAFITWLSFAIFQVNIPFAGGVHMNLTPLIGILAGPSIGSLIVLIVNILSAAIGHGGWGLIGANTRKGYRSISDVTFNLDGERSTEIGWVVFETIDKQPESCCGVIGTINNYATLRLFRFARTQRPPSSALRPSCPCNGRRLLRSAILFRASSIKRSDTHAPPI
jgi:hypothetical protein